MKRIIAIIASISLLCGVVDLNAKKRSKEETEAEIAATFAEMQKNFTEENYEWTFTSIMDAADGVSKEDIFNAAVSTLSRYVTNDPDSGITSSNLEAGNVVAQLLFPVNTGRGLAATTLICRATVQISIKPGRYRVMLTLHGMRFDGSNPYLTRKEFKVDDFYPYWTKCKSHLTSFNSLVDIYNACMDRLNLTSTTMAKQIADSDW